MARGMTHSFIQHQVCVRNCSALCSNRVHVIPALDSFVSVSATPANSRNAVQELFLLEIEHTEGSRCEAALLRGREEVRTYFFTENITSHKIE